MQPTVLLGLDGATFTILKPLVANGDMPNLRAFLEEGAQAELLSTPHPLTPPAWSTLMTGRNPGSHGVFDFLRAGIHDNKGFFTLNNFRDLRCETLWTLISRWGGRVISLNFPMMAPPPAVAGAVVPGFISWRHLRRNVYPPELYEEIKALPDFDLKELSCDIERETATVFMKEEELVPWVRDHVLGRDRQWFGILRHLMRTQPADLTAVIFDGVDKLQHICWPFLDPACRPARLNPVEQELRDQSLAYFRQLDGLLGETIRLAGPEANILIVSDHGFGPAVRSFRVNKWLEQHGYLRWPETAASGRAPRNTHFVHLDWAGTTAFAQSAATNGIFIRVKRNADDVGVPTDEYQAFRARLVEQLRTVRDPVTGAPFLKDILLREEAFPGAHQDKAPDLTLVPWDHGMISVLNVEPVIAVRPAPVGTHYPRGVLIARGPSMARACTLPTQSILDIAPTLLYSLDLPVPVDYEGRVIEDLFDAGYRAGHPVRTGPATQPPGQPAAAPRHDPQAEAAEEAGIMQRLRDLGYVE